MENLNIAPFVPDDKVVYIGVTDRFIKNGSIHIVKRCGIQPCGCWFVDTDKHCHFTIAVPSTCPICDKTTLWAYGIFDTGRHTVCLSSTEFRKVQEQPFRAVSFEKIMEETEKICVN